MLTLRLALLELLLSISLASCTGEGTPVQGPDKASCNSGLAPVDVHLPANTCGVYPLEIPEPTARHFPQIPHNYVAQSVSVDLYIEGSETCGIGSALCGVDDNRPFVSKDSPDPGADPSRTRAHMILDFASGTLTLRISPSCRIHVSGPGLNLNNQKECFAPKRVGEGTSLTVTEPRHGTVGVELTVIQTNYPTLLNLGEVHNYWEFTPHPDGTVDITGSGTNFPDFDVIHYGRLVCADRGVHLSNVFAPPPIGQRSYNCHEVGLGDQTPAGPIPVPFTGASATELKTFEPWVAVGHNGGYAPAPGLAVTNGGSATCDSGSNDDPGRFSAVRCFLPGSIPPCFVFIRGGDAANPLLCSNDPTSNQVTEVTPTGNGVPVAMLNHEKPSQPPWFLVLADGRKCSFQGYGTNTDVLSYDCSGGVEATTPDRSKPMWTVREGTNQANPTLWQTPVAVVTAYR